ncbi:hypothetical protein Leryth_022348 [Lithospermum erythrorhizon]|nr:hypothetical protein Leryth_022348 [Lithospermum erythrorhizon]
MANGEWFKKMIILKKEKGDKPRKLKKISTCKKPNGGMLTSRYRKVSSKSKNKFFAKIHRMDEMQIENTAATHIQSSFRAYKARKAFRRLKGTRRLQTLMQGYSGKSQASTTLSYLHSWSKIQAEVEAHRMSMAAEGRIRQKNQSVLDAKLHDQEVEFDSGAETMEEINSKIRQRDEAAVKRERALAYAFSHQWRPNSNFGLVNSEYGKEDWGWSWMDRWIAARPWESRVPVRASLKNGHSQQDCRVGKKLTSPTTKTNVKSISPNGKVASKARKLTFEASEKLNPRRSADKIQSVNRVKYITTF